MRSLVLMLLVGIVSLLLCAREVGSQKNGGRGKYATSLCDELITPNGYNCIEHQAVTDDGFVLGLQNMPSPRGSTVPSGGPSVLLMHGLLAGGDNWVVNTPQESLAFILADDGFDVWIANNRVVQWSHGHQTYTPSDDGYWAWTYDEQASYDLKALIGYVYNQKGGMKLIYVGHSAGSLLLFAGLTGGAFKNEILGYLNAAVLMAPTALASHLTATVVKVSLTIMADQILILMPNGKFDSNTAFNISCTSPLIAPLACEGSYTGVLGQNSYLDSSRLPFYSQYYTQPTSTFNMNHLGQGFRTGTFQFYDKGEAGNLGAYGQATPPNYDLTSFPASLPLQLWAGGIDGLADPTDVQATFSMLPTLNREVHTLANYGHVDFILGTNAYVDVYPTLIPFLHNHANKGVPKMSAASQRD